MGKSIRIRAVCGLLLALGLFTSCERSDKELRKVLKDSLVKSQTQSDWFVALEVAIADLTPEQASWKDSSNNHSICEEVSHLIFWNQRVLQALKGEDVAEFEDENTVTFKSFCDGDWDATRDQLLELNKDWEVTVENTSEEKLREWSQSISSIAAHNAYHTGQIVYIRKMNGWWNPEQGVQ